MAEPILCPQCGHEIPPGSPAGLCPKCLVMEGMESHSTVDVKLPPSPPSLPSPPTGSGFVPPTVRELAARFPQLEILGLLGRGGMGAVYKARQKELDRLVAVKILPPEIGGDPAFAERFTREARAMARLSHPNIVAVYDFGRTGDGLFFFVMEYVDGVNLRQAIQSGGMAPKDALAIVPQICDALQFAHDEGIVHRDIKPENILVDKRGRVKIADFGIAKLLGSHPGDASLTGTQQVMGTLRYMAPEQMEGTKAVDHRADIYSLGVVFYELLTGELPIGRFAPPSKKVQIDVRLDEVVFRALEKEPELRYQHVSEVKSEVEQIGRSGGPAPRTPEAAGARGGSGVAGDRQVLAPAVALALVSGFTGLTGVARFLEWLVGTLAKQPTGEDPAGILILAAAGGTILFGAVQMMRRKTYGLAIACSITVIVAGFVAGCGLVKPTFLVVGLPVGIWALITLRRPVVKAMFGATKGAGAAAEMVPPGAPAPAADHPPGRSGNGRRAGLLVKLALWTAFLCGVLYLLPLVCGDRAPWMVNDGWRLHLKPGSGAYLMMTLRAEHRLYGWLQSQGGGSISKSAWTGTATLDLPYKYTTPKLILERDSYLDEWRWTGPGGGSVNRLKAEPSPQDVAALMQYAGIDIGKPGVLEEAAALLGLLKEAGFGIPPGGRPSGRWRMDPGAKIGPFTSEGGYGFDERVQPDHLAAVFLSIWIPGILLILRRPLWRLAARQTGRWTAIGALSVSIAAGAFSAVVLSLTLDGYFGRAVHATRTIGGVLVMVTCAVSVLAPVLLLILRRRFLALPRKRQMALGAGAPVGLLVLMALFMVLGLKGETTVLPFPFTPKVTLRFHGDWAPGIEVEPGMARDGGTRGGESPGPEGLAFRYECSSSTWGYRSPAWPVTAWVNALPEQLLVKLSGSSTEDHDGLRVSIDFANAEIVDLDIAGLPGAEIALDGTPVPAPVRIRPGTHRILIRGSRNDMILRSVEEALRPEMPPETWAPLLKKGDLTPEEVRKSMGPANFTSFLLAAGGDALARLQKDHAWQLDALRPELLAKYILDHSTAVAGGNIGEIEWARQQDGTILGSFSVDSPYGLKAKMLFTARERNGALAVTRLAVAGKRSADLAEGFTVFEK